MTCACCGAEFSLDRLVVLRRRDDLAVCQACSHWLVERHRRTSGPVARDMVPIFLSADVSRARAHYEALGFAVEAYLGEDGYAFVRRDDAEFHIAGVDQVDAATTTSAAYLYLDNARRVYDEWSTAGVGGRFVAPRPTEYGLLEGAHVDPDGNLIRFGSPIVG